MSLDKKERMDVMEGVTNYRLNNSKCMMLTPVDAARPFIRGDGQ